MKKVVLVLLTILMTWLNGWSQSNHLEDYIHKSKRGAEHVLDISVPGWLTRLGWSFVKEEEGDYELDALDPLVDNIRKVRVVIVEHEQQKMPVISGMSLRERALADNYEELISIRDGLDQVHVFIREKKEYIRDVLVAINDGEGEFVLVNVRGKFTMEDVNDMIQNIQEMEDREQESQQRKMDLETEEL